MATFTNPPTGLRLDHDAEPLGVDERHPRLSWLLPDGASRQIAYRVEADGWDSDRVESTSSTYVEWGGHELTSRRRIEWRVKVWTDAGESEWSEAAWWEMGLLEPTDWRATFVSPVEEVIGPPGHRPAHLLRRTFEVPALPERARAYATAHGIYELFINGARVGDRELSPGSTAYRTHLEVQTYDITALLRAGENTVCSVLSDGWYRGLVGFTREHDTFGRDTSLLVQIELDLPDGEQLVVGTDESWECTATGPIVAADLIEGQHVDHRIEPDGWGPVRVVAHDFDRLTTSPAPPVRRVEELVPTSVRELRPGVHVVDLGQNINGWMRLTDLGPAGTTTTLTHGERLGPDGDVDMGHLKPFDFVTREPLSAGQVDSVTSAGTSGEVFEPRHTTHGFQFVRIEGHPGPLTTDDIRGVVVHTDLRRTGWFRCSDDRLNRLHEAALWSFRDNACEVPTDCPQRERAGWTGDWQIFAPTAAFLYDVAGFSARWLRDLAADQWPDGRVPNFIPDPAGPAAHDHPIARFMTGAAGWGDAAVLVPWDMWLAYGDRRFLERQYESMVAWVEFAERAANEGRHASRVAANPVPEPHEAHLWDSGFHWGEWCEPGGNPEGLFTLETDVADVATAYLHHSSKTLAEVAALLGKDADADRWKALASAALDAWRTEFIDADGTIRPHTQANLVRALAFGLVPDEARAAAADQLVALVRAAGNHVGTGFLATPYLLPVLADAGHADVAFDLLLQDTVPAWLPMIDQGATTIWESWEGVDAEEGVGSLNHYSKGAVITFLHRYVAGIRPEPDAVAWGRFRIEPVLGGGITSAEAEFDSPSGRIRSAWRISDRRFALEVIVPAGTEATVLLPGGERHEAGPGTHRYEAVVPPT
jgi:alpha-L-rhamnosidase